MEQEQEVLALTPTFKNNSKQNDDIFCIDIKNDKDDKTDELNQCKYCDKIFVLKQI